jgi:hypothetical protein
MFDLNEQIGKWCNGLARSEAFQGRDIDELESHLREEIENLMAAKLSEQEAFSVAARRLGDSNALADEFAKINTGTLLSNRLCWMAVGVLLYLILAYIAGAASRGFALLGITSGLRGYYVGIVSLLATALILAVTVLLLYRAFRQNLTGSILGPWAASLKGQVFIVSCLLVTLVALAATKTLFIYRAARITPLAEFGEITLIFAIVSNLALPILFPVLLTILLIRLRTSKLRGIGA